MDTYERFSCEDCILKLFEGCDVDEICEEMEDDYMEWYIEQGRIAYREEWFEYIEELQEE